MMMVDTELKPSPIHGLGVFLKHPVRRGDLIWRFDPRIDRVYGEAEIEALPAHVQDYLRIYSTWHEDTRLFVLCGDNGRYFNHSDRPSTVSDAISFGEDRAARDLDAGEELTSDYNTICDAVRLRGYGFATER
ncbi:MAG TPA: SET domain-containing protein-lysine N-methyltransferase [Salinarimonas sp.]|nr:SET domain-containing protein-lysine N-methyltransferase [Salinarimonas sp.]